MALKIGLGAEEGLSTSCWTDTAGGDIGSEETSTRYKYWAEQSGFSGVQACIEPAGFPQTKLFVVETIRYGLAFGIER
jgi:hypothetical protein